MSTNYVKQRRTRIRGLAQSPAVVRSIPAPFVRGINTERPSWQLDPQECPAGADFIFPKGLAVPRGAYVSASSASGLGTADPLATAAAIELPSYGGTGTQPDPALVAVNTNGRIGLLNGGFGAAATGLPAGDYLIREVYKGEVLICPQDGISSIIRFAGAPNGVLTGNSAAAGTVSYYQGSSFVLGTGTTFTSQARVGTYLILGQFPGQSRLVTAVNSATNLSVDGVFPITTGIPAPPAAPTPLYSGQAWGSASGASRYGHFGLCTPVQTLGQASATTGLGTTVSGFGTVWGPTTQIPLGHGRPAANDYFGIRGTYPSLSAIASITDDDTLVLTAAPGSDYANRPYVIYRPAVGRECRYHLGRLYITNIDWDPWGVYYTPLNSPLGAFYNTDHPTATITSDFAVSQLLLKFDVPIQGASGSNVALLSTPQGLLVLRTDGAYLIMGDPPVHVVQKLADGAGCIDLRSACVGNRGEGAFWAGANGIYRYVGGRIVDLTEGRRNREWRAMVNAGVGVNVACGVLDSHLFVSVYGLLENFIDLWVYDLLNNAWCGDFSGGTIKSMYPFRSEAQKNDDLYFTPGGSGVGSIGVSQVGRLGSIARDEGGLGTSSLYGTFQAELPEVVVGQPSDYSRVIEAKTTYELTGSGATMALESNVDGGSFGTDVTLATTSAGPQTVRTMPGSDVAAVPSGALGKLGRRHGHRVTQTGTKPTALRVHQIDLVVRPRRARA